MQRTLAAYLIFFGSYFVFALGKFPGMKIDRPGAAIIGAVLMVAFRIVGPHDALAYLDFATLVLLFSMMLIVANLHLAGFFDWLAEWVIYRLQPHHLLPKVIFTSGLLSGFLVHDNIYLLAVATGSNIGSVATITGNPQNILIGSVSRISYLEFIMHLGPVAVIGLLADWALIHRLFLRSELDRVEVREVIAAPEFALAPLRKKPIVVLALVLIG